MAEKPLVAHRSVGNLASEAARTKLVSAGALSTAWQAPSKTKPPTEEELIELGELSQGAPTILDLVNEDRGGI